VRKKMKRGKKRASSGGSKGILKYSSGKGVCKGGGHRLLPERLMVKRSSFLEGRSCRCGKDAAFWGGGAEVKKFMWDRSAGKRLRKKGISSYDWIFLKGFLVGGLSLGLEDHQNRLRREIEITPGALCAVQTLSAKVEPAQGMKKGSNRMEGTFKRRRNSLRGGKKGRGDSKPKKLEQRLTEVSVGIEPRLTLERHRHNQRRGEAPKGKKNFAATTRADPSIVSDSDPQANRSSSKSP